TPPGRVRNEKGPPRCPSLWTRRPTRGRVPPHRPGRPLTALPRRKQAAPAETTAAADHAADGDAKSPLRRKRRRPPVAPPRRWPPTTATPRPTFPTGPVRTGPRRTLQPGP